VPATRSRYVKQTANVRFGFARPRRGPRSFKGGHRYTDLTNNEITTALGVPVGVVQLDLFLEAFEGQINNRLDEAVKVGSVPSASIASNRASAKPGGCCASERGRRINGLDEGTASVWLYTETMPVTLNLPDDALARLEAEAERRGVTMDELVAEIAASLPSEAGQSTPRKLRFFAMGSSTAGRHAADADEMLAEGFGRD